MPERSLDLGLIILYLVSVTVFGARFRKRQFSLKDYFLGGKSSPWWAISLSIVAAETSTLTIIGTPALAFSSDLGFLQVVFGYLAARILVCVLFIPHYRRGQMYTAYELMERRFGPRLRRFTSSTFLVTRSLAEGVRVFAISLVVSVVLDTGDLESITLIMVLTLFYTFHGGMTAVIWTDVVQVVLCVMGAILSAVLILESIPGGWPQVVEVAEMAGKFRVFDFYFAPTAEFFSRTYTFWAGLLGGCFLATATHGTDQLIVQRLLSTRTERESKLALLASWIVIFLLFSLFLVIGVMLWVFYQDAGLVAPEPRDRLYPFFIWHHLPPVASGIAVAAVLAAAMSNLSAALNSLASATVMDFYLHWKGETVESSPAQHLKISRWVTLVWGLVLLGIAILARRWGSVLEAGLSIASIPLGALLGVFALGVLTKRVCENAAIAGMIAGFVVILFVRYGTSVAWTWYVVIGATVTFGFALLCSLALTRMTGGVRSDT